MKIQIAAVQQRPWQLEGRGIALLRHARQGRAAGVAQAHELGGFVKRFARRVVNGFAQNFVAPTRPPA